jgi:predicted subunit of tRNA(5-methylaminomethyl-2-thiouridylate) methyltransferase
MGGLKNMLRDKTPIIHYDSYSEKELIVDKRRACHNCGKSTSFVDYIYNTGRGLCIEGSFNLKELKKLWNKYNIEYVKFYCRMCYKIIRSLSGNTFILD